MGSLLGLFGDNEYVAVAIALAIVVLLIVLGVWALKAISSATGRASRGRAKRLGVVDASHVDQKRQLVLVRRDNVEHLLLIGGPQDLVIETNIYSGPPMGRPTRPAQSAAPASQQQAPAASPPSPSQAPVVASPAPARVRNTNLPADLVATRTTPTPGTSRNSLRNSSMMRSPERREPEFIPSPRTQSSAPLADSDKQAETEPVPNEVGTGSAQPDYANEPQIDRDGDDMREANKDN